MLISCKCATIMGTVYKTEKCWLMIGTTELSFGTVPQFGLLYDILVYGPEPSILFVVLVMQTIAYNSILGAYEILPLTEYKCFYRSSICCYYLFNAVRDCHGTMYIKPKYDLSVYCNYK